MRIPWLLVTLCMKSKVIFGSHFGHYRHSDHLTEALRTIRGLLSPIKKEDVKTNYFWTCKITTTLQILEQVFAFVFFRFIPLTFSHWKSHAVLDQEQCFWLCIFFDCSCPCLMFVFVFSSLFLPLCLMFVFATCGRPRWPLGGCGCVRSEDTLLGRGHALPAGEYFVLFGNFYSLIHFFRPALPACQFSKLICICIFICTDFTFWLELGESFLYFQNW